MSAKIKPGDRVSWNTSQGKTKGRVVKQLTCPTKIRGHVAKPSKDDPQYLVKSDKTGGKAAHKPSGLKKV
jgi:Hypervirulence associated proteins TUDOR domain